MQSTNKVQSICKGYTLSKVRRVDKEIAKYYRDQAIRAGVDKSFPYFMKVLTMKAADHCANSNQKYEKFGKMPESIKKIMQGV